jgi:hypothetical protein
VMTQQTIIANEKYVLTQPHYDSKIGDVVRALRYSEPDTNLFRSPHWLFDMINGKGLRVIPVHKVKLKESDAG